MMLNQFAKAWLTLLRKNFKRNWWEKFKQLLLLITIISFSSNLFYKLSIDEAYVKGLLVDYLIPKIYLFDCLLIVNLIVYFLFEKNYRILQKIKIKLKKIDKLILLLSIIYLIKQLLFINLSSIIFYFRLILIFLFILSLSFNQKRRQIVYQALFISIIWQSFLTYYQFFKQQSLAPYYIFGESNLQNFAAISRAQFLTAEKILPYGSMAHPNILAGIISLFTVIIVDKKRLGKITSGLVVLNALIIAFLTQSLSALLTLTLFLFYLLISSIKKNNQQSKKPQATWQKTFVLSLAFLFIITPIIIKQLTLSFEKNYLSISRRNMLNEAAWKMFLDKPVFGLGTNNFVKELENYSQHQEAVRFVQPVHHLGLLLLAESGLLSLIIVLLMIWKLRKEIDWAKLIVLVPIFSLDHYLFTQTVGILSLALFIFLTRDLVSDSNQEL